MPRRRAPTKDQKMQAAPSVCQSVSLSVCLCAACVLVCLSVCLSVCLAVWLSACLSMRPSFRPPRCAHASKRTAFAPSRSRNLARLFDCSLRGSTSRSCVALSSKQRQQKDKQWRGMRPKRGRSSSDATRRCDHWCNFPCMNDPGRTRTCNLWFRRPTPYPLGHRAKCLTS